MTAYVLLGSLLALLAWLFCPQRLSGFQSLADHRQGWLHRELWRRNSMVLMKMDGFPRPVEERVLAWRIGGLLVWTEHSSIGLPLETDWRIDQIGAEEFDQHFTPRFRMVGPHPGAERHMAGS